ncbi:hypothetical protein [Mesorhizobium sp. B1-1-8]|uniref:hypothetical protein n=1 Tax=Mesorhizobium sp. B1-1-8 TaxID=2589976 RepID=UPI0015E27206|nr:hypothetical protein [Mesorhizobium sp. B1-1-8]UCI06567.1 hypothetical protein FJ974_22560 [Mesorhizobium sp. B1-1-8]
MRFTLMSRRQRLGELAGRIFVNVLAVVIAGVAILFLLLSAHYQGSPSAAETTITAVQ